MQTLEQFLDEIENGIDCMDCGGISYYTVQRAAKIIRVLDSFAHSEFDNYLKDKISKILNENSDE